MSIVPNFQTSTVRAMGITEVNFYKVCIGIVTVAHQFQDCHDLVAYEFFAERADQARSWPDLPQPLIDRSAPFQGAVLFANPASAAKNRIRTGRS